MTPDADYARLCALQWRLAILNDLCRLVQLRALWQERERVCAELRAMGVR